MKALSGKQRRIVRFAFGPGKTLIAAGATRSGKSFAAALSHGLWMFRHGGGHLHLLAGRSVANAWLNVGVTLVETLRALGARVEGSGTSGTFTAHVLGGPAVVRLVGASDVSARTRIQGYTLASMHVDELSLVHPEFWPWAWSRLSVEGAKAWATLNPEGPAHVVKRNIIDRLADFDGQLVDMRMEDNPSLSAEVRASVAGGLHGHLYQRLVLGLWAGASGAVYPRWESVQDAPVFDDSFHAVGFDWGPGSTTAAVLVRCRPAEGRFPAEAVVVDEWVIDARETDSPTDADVVAGLRRWLAGHGLTPDGLRLYVDPSTHPGFKRLAREAGWKVPKVENDVLPGIAVTDARLSTGNVRLLAGACPKLEVELAGYVWDEKAQERGEDRPVKSADHLVDALRYWAFTTGRRSRLEAYRARVSGAAEAA